MKQPSVRSTAFYCPHCSAFTTQYWHELYAKFIENNERRVPSIPNAKFLETLKKEVGIDAETITYFTERVRKFQEGLVFIEQESDTKYLNKRAENLHISECYNCKKIAVWVHEKLVFPDVRVGALPNQDLPEDIKVFYEEARSILNQSPRGAAALLRLCIQMLCEHLGETGKTLDDQIASLVAKGLKPLVQRSLDIVRVIGNESIHPGSIDLNDDRETAVTLFDLVNTIADQMISHPKSVHSIYEKLPESKREAIEKRNEKAKGKVGP